MSAEKPAVVSEEIINKAISLGASLAGIASLDLLKKSPSHDIYSKIEPNQGTGSRDLRKVSNAITPTADADLQAPGPHVGFMGSQNSF